MNSLSAPAASSTEVSGHFDYILDDHAFGWAFAPAHPQKRLTIEIIASGEVVAQGPAQQYREDLQTAGIGDGCYLFDLQLSHELFDGQVHELTARIADTGGILAGGPHAFGPERREPAYPQIPRAIGLGLLAVLMKQAKYSRFADNRQNFARAYRLASRLQETGEVGEARSAWSTINSALGENSLGYCKLGECLMLSGLASEALDAFRVAAGCDLRLHWAHLGIANSQFALGQFEQAEYAMQMAIALQPQDGTLTKHLKCIQDEYLMNRIEALIAEQNHEDAVAVVKAFLLKRPDSNQAGTLLRELLYSKSNNFLPGMLQLQKLQTEQIMLEALLDDVESRLGETNS